MNRVIINTHRYGDIMLNLPIAKAWADAGDRVWWCVHHHFVHLLDGVSYVTPIVFQGDMNDREDAERAARNIAPKDSEFVCLQAKMLKARGVQCHRFSPEPWANVGMLDQFHELPLVLDRRDTSRDIETLRQHWKHNGRPVLALCLKGYSSNPELCGWGKDGAIDFRQWIVFHARTVLKWDVVDIGELKLPSILDLVPLLESAVALVSVDTAVVHLAYATNTPTITLSAGSEWDKSEPRHNWIGQFTYPKAMTPDGRERIVKLLGQKRPYKLGTMVRTPAEMRCTPILHCYDSTPGKDAVIEHRLALARGSWDMIDWSGWRQRPLRKEDPARFKDVIESAIVGADPSDIVCFTAADRALVPDVGHVLAATLESTTCCFSPTVDMERVEFMHSRASLPKPNGAPGVFAFTVDWWRGYQDQLSNRVISEDGWESELRRVMLACNPKAELTPAIAYRQFRGPAAPSPIIETSRVKCGAIIQVVHVYDAPPDEKRRNSAARSTWDVAVKNDGNWFIAEHHTIGGGRSSADVGDSREVPYIRDLFDYAASWGDDSDILVLANADIHLVPDAGAAIRDAVERAHCGYAWRITVPAERMTLDRAKLAAVRTDFGIDLFACRKSWWMAIRDIYPDFFLGCTGWDVVMRKMMDRHSAFSCISPPIYCHEQHDSFWKIHNQNPANAHNQKLWDEWEQTKQWQTRTAI